MKLCSTDGRIRGSTHPLSLLVSPCLCAVMVAGSIAALPVQVQAQDSEHPMASAPIAPQDLRDLVKTYMASGNHDQAISCLLAILASKPSDAISFKADLGLCYKFKREFDKAMPILAEVGAVSNPRQAEALFLIDDSYCEQGNFSKAVDHLTTVYNQHPELRDNILLRRINRFEALGKTKEAIADSKQYLTEYPTGQMSGMLKLKLAELMLRENGLTPEFQTALSQAESASGSEVNPEFAKIISNGVMGLYFGSADAMWNSGKKTEALIYLTKMYSDYPELRPQVLTKRSSWYEALSQTDKALADYREYVVLSPNDDLAKRIKLKIAESTYRLKGKNGEFPVLLQEAAETVSAETDAALAKELSYELGSVYINTEQWDKAISHYQSLVADYPVDALAHNKNLGRSYKGKRDYANALPLLKEVAEKSEGDEKKDASFLVVDCLTEQGLNEEAIETMNKMLADHSDWRDAILYRRAVCKCELKKYSESMADLQAYMKDYSELDWSKCVELMNAQITLYNLKDSGTARKLLNNFIVKRPDCPEMIVAKQELAYCSYNENKFAEAALVFEDAAKSPEVGNFRALTTFMAGLSHKRAGNKLGVQAALETLIKKYPDDPFTKVAPEIYSIPMEDSIAAENAVQGGTGK